LQADRIVQERWAAADREEVTRYSRHNPEEYFAESFAGYHLEREWMRKNAPKALRMVEDVLKLRGLL
jgi:hypothetical protein